MSSVIIPTGIYSEQQVWIEPYPHIFIFDSIAGVLVPTQSSGAANTISPD